MEPALDLFGDDSVVNSAVVYGLVILLREKTSLAEVALNEVKRKFGGRDADRLHCRELFAGDRRRKSAWKHLLPEDVFSLCWEAADAVTSVGAAFRVGFVDRRGLPEQMCLAGRHPDTPTGPKQLLSFAYAGVLAGFEDSPGKPSVRFWADPDHTKILWAGKRRKSANVPLAGAVAPEIIVGEKPLLLDVADILAYCSAQTLSAEARSNKESFRAIFSRFSPRVGTFSFDEQAFTPIPSWPMG